MRIDEVTSDLRVQQVRELCREYQISIGISLDFQNFEKEMESLPGAYQPPKGRLYLATTEEMPAACIALRDFGSNQCEMKRLYVRPQFRGQGLGKVLANRVIADAREIGYRSMLLDTLSTMTMALQLYRSLGFKEILPYRFNPIEGAHYMSLDL